MRRHRISILLVFLLAVALFPIQAWSAPPADVPAPSSLSGWRNWVLHGQEENLCPFVFNNGQDVKCAWPSRLTLNIENGQGGFRQQWAVFADSWAPLPGGRAMWPAEVLVDGQKSVVVGREGVPAVRLEPGEHLVEGRFSWPEMPEMIQVPAASGLVDLTINGRTIDFPVLDATGRLWLQKRAETQGQENLLEVRIQRLILDDIPMRVVNRLKINVSGRAREVTLEGVLLDQAVPMSIDSPLPARLDQGNRLKLQVRAGSWEISLVTRFEGPVTEIGPIKGAFGRETWAFDSRNHLRLVRIDGPTAVDPSQTDLPASWKEFPTYIVEPEAVMAFKELRRGDPDPAPDRLDLRRSWWLDFDGRGFTVQDNISGTMSRQWYLAMAAPGLLGRVSVDGQDQLITAQGPDQAPGVELRRGALRLTADSRYESDSGSLPAVGWAHDFQSVSGELHLPPGWRLLSAQGVDNLPGTWVQRWTLLDLFLVLIIALAAFKLTGWTWGLLALVTLALTYHEPDAPRLVWLNLLAASALIKVLPDGWAKRLAGLWRLGSIITLLVLAIPFMIDQARIGMYPQLEQTQDWYQGQTGKFARMDMSVNQDVSREEYNILPSAPAPMVERKKAVKDKSVMLQQQMGGEGQYYEKRQAVLTQDPNALNQTGPGLPTWDWKTIPMSWNGPVSQDQTISLWLLPPLANTILAFTRVILLALLILGLIDLRNWWRRLDKGAKAAAAIAGLCLCLTASAAPALAQDQTNGYPPAELLQEFQKRLLEKPDCLPYCAHYPRLEVNVTSRTLTLRLEIHAAAETAVPLPGHAESWLPRQVLLDDLPSQGLHRGRDGVLWMLAPQGVHTAVLIGPIPPGNSFQIPLELRPNRVEVTAEGWEVRGVGPDGQVESSLELTSLQKEDTDIDKHTGAVLPPFLHVERTVSLGLTWQVYNKITRLTPTGAPIMISVPLLPGESVTAAGVRVENGHALINLDARAQELEWVSTLEQSTPILLEAPQGRPWTETWILDASPIWHCTHSGLPVIHHQDEEGHWRPQWQPWPGETVRIDVVRPPAVPGQTVTIDRADLNLTPGERFNKAGLSLQIRSSQGGQHLVQLPAGAQLQEVRIKDKSQPIDAENGQVVLPLQPGSQDIYLEWHQPSDSLTLVKSPEIRIGEQAVNAQVTFNMPENRWILLAWGPRLGPAVLFWSYLFVIILAALALGRVRWTPLKTHHWLLLGLGLTQIHPLLALVIVGWLLILDYRARHVPPDKWLPFDAAQLGLVIWTGVALLGLYYAIEKGLLGIPHMQIMGNGSSDFTLYWTQDRIGALMPQPWVLSLPRLVYHGLMLIWALWLALSLLKWLRWGWQSFNHGGLWKKPRLRKKDQAAESEFLIE
jgi:hypothetical protein